MGFKENNTAEREDIGLPSLSSPPPCCCPYRGAILREERISLVYLRVTAEACSDNGHTLNDAFEAPQVDPLHPGA